MNPFTEWLSAIVSLTAGLLFLRMGMAIASFSGRSRKLFAFLCVYIVIFALLIHFTLYFSSVGQILSLIGGEEILAVYAGLILIGIAWSSGRGNDLRYHLIFAGSLLFLFLGIYVFAPIAWRFTGAQLYKNYPDRHGMIQQSTGITCAPASAAMLLYCYGVKISEGEMAERAGTNLLTGTNKYLLARAMDMAGGQKHIRADAEHLTYNSAYSLQRPFITYIFRRDIGGHAILVMKMKVDDVSTIDPRAGSVDHLNREQFEHEWSGIVIRLVPQMNYVMGI
jgi:hypothetical protein